MKILLLVFAIASLAFLAGCATASGGPSKIQQALDNALPPDFAGDAEVGHKNAYFDFDIQAKGLRRTDRGWTWRELRYRRNGRFSSGWITLGPSAAP